MEQGKDQSDQMEESPEISQLRAIQSTLVFKKEGPHISLADDPPIGVEQRRLLWRGVCEKRGTHARIKRTTRRAITLFNDLLLICHDTTVKQVLPLTTVLVHDMVGTGEWHITSPERSFVMSCSKGEKAIWLEQLRQAMVGLFGRTTRAAARGWLHRIMTGTPNSLALHGESGQIQALRDKEGVDDAGEPLPPGAGKLAMWEESDDQGETPCHYAAYGGHVGTWSCVGPHGNVGRDMSSPSRLRRCLSMTHTVDTSI